MTRDCGSLKIYRAAQSTVFAARTPQHTMITCGLLMAESTNYSILVVV